MTQPIENSHLQRLFDEHCATGVIPLMLIATPEQKAALQAILLHWHCLGSNSQEHEKKIEQDYRNSLTARP